MTSPVSTPADTSSSAGAARSLEVKTGPRFRLRVYWPNPPELRCPKCGDWFQITPEHWHLNQWSECRVCHSGRQALADWLKRRADPAYRRKERLRSKKYRDELKASAPHLLRFLDGERRARQAERLRTWRAKRRTAA